MPILEARVWRAAAGLNLLFALGGALLWDARFLLAVPAGGLFSAILLFWLERNLSESLQLSHDDHSTALKRMKRGYSLRFAGTLLLFTVMGILMKGPGVIGAAIGLLGLKITLVGMAVLGSPILRMDESTAAVEGIE